MTLLPHSRRAKDITPFAQPQHPNLFRARRAFTLVELLVVLAMISLIAAMIFPVTKAVTRFELLSLARAEMAQLESCINSYKASLGHNPQSEQRHLNSRSEPAGTRLSS